MLKITSEILIPDYELHWTFARSSGSGGQNVNKVSSKAQLHFNVSLSASLPDDVRERFTSRYFSRMTSAGEIVISSDRHRDKPKNMKDCLEKLKQMIVAVATPPKVRRPTKPTRSSKKKRADSKRLHSQKKARRRSGFDMD